MRVLLCVPYTAQGCLDGLEHSVYGPGPGWLQHKLAVTTTLSVQTTLLLAPHYFNKPSGHLLSAGPLPSPLRALGYSYEHAGSILEADSGDGGSPMPSAWTVPPTPKPLVTQ